MAEIRNLVKKIEAIQWDGTNLADFTSRFPVFTGGTYYAASEEDGLLVITQVDEEFGNSYPQPGQAVGTWFVISDGGGLMEVGNWEDFADRYVEVPPPPPPAPAQ